MLGKNGEPKAKVDISLTLSINNVKKPHQVTLMTDSEGKINLGLLEYVNVLEGKV